MHHGILVRYVLVTVILSCPFSGADPSKELIDLVKKDRCADLKKRNIDNLYEFAELSRAAERQCWAIYLEFQKWSREEQGECKDGQYAGCSDTRDFLGLGSLTHRCGLTVPGKMCKTRRVSIDRCVKWALQKNRLTSPFRFLSFGNAKNPNPPQPPRSNPNPPPQSGSNRPKLNIAHGVTKPPAQPTLCRHDTSCGCPDSNRHYEGVLNYETESESGHFMAVAPPPPDRLPPPPFPNRPTHNPRQEVPQPRKVIRPEMQRGGVYLGHESEGDSARWVAYAPPPPPSTTSTSSPESDPESDPEWIPQPPPRPPFMTDAPRIDLPPTLPRPRRTHSSGGPTSQVYPQSNGKPAGRGSSQNNGGSAGQKAFNNNTKSRKKPNGKGVRR